MNATVAPPAASPVFRAKFSAVPPNGDTVLILDDDRVMRTVLARSLQAFGYRVIEAERISDARKSLAKNTPDLIIVDGLLPDGTGMQFITELRGANNIVPVLFFSSFFRDRKSFDALHRELRVASILHKPLAPSAFLKEVRAVLSGG